jgi:hypothetical protein
MSAKSEDRIHELSFPTDIAGRARNSAELQPRLPKRFLGDERAPLHHRGERHPKVSAHRAASTHRASAIGVPPADPIRPMLRPADHKETGDISAAFARESECARALVLKHGKFWQFLLVQELLRSKSVILKNECGALEADRRASPTLQLTSEEFVGWLSAEMGHFLTSIARMKTCIEDELLAALGKRGVSGDAIDILRAVDALFEASRSFVVFERNLCTIDPPKELVAVKRAFDGIAMAIAETMERFSNDWDSALQGLRNGSRRFAVNATIDAPPQVAMVSAILETLDRSTYGAVRPR